LEQVGALSPLLLKVALQYAVMNIQVNQEDLEMTHQFLISADDINFLAETYVRHIRKKNTKDLSVDSKDIGLEANA
jgi:hypothetical protein